MRHGAVGSCVPCMVYGCMGRSVDPAGHPLPSHIGSGALRIEVYQGETLENSPQGFQMEIGMRGCHSDTLGMHNVVVS